MTQTEHPKDSRSSGGGKSSLFKAVRKPLSERTVTVSLSLPKALFGVFFIVLVLVWAFIFGIMIGRGHNPEAMIPPLAKVMPSPADPRPERPTQPEVIPPQDLKYHSTLKAKQTAEPQRVPVPAKPAHQQQNTAAKQPPVRQKQPDAPPARQKQQETPPARQATTKTVDSNRFNYSYQVGASTNAQSAEALSRKLQGAGIAARVIQTDSGNTVWHRVMVAFTGTPEDTRKLREKLAPFGISSIILRSKVPTQ